jgi:hypothetical protein
VKGAAWAVPVIAAAIATPLAAASRPVADVRERMRFTNATATTGANRNSIYVNTKVQLMDGPAPAEQVMLSIGLSRGGKSVTKTWPAVAGWGATETVSVEFPDVPRGTPVDVTFTAWAIGVKTITAQSTVVTPNWWA